MRKLRRRDECYLVGLRASKIRGAAAAVAWHLMADHLMALDTKDVPKYKDVLNAVRQATIKVREIQKGVSFTRR